MQIVDDVQFVIAPEVHQLVGEVHITYIDEIGRKGFSLTSDKPISEWEGFSVTDIKV